MVRLVDDLLDVSRISRGKVELRNSPLDLVSLVRDGIETARPGCANKGIELKLALPVHPLLAKAMRRGWTRWSATCSTTPASTPTRGRVGLISNATAVRR